MNTIAEIAEFVVRGMARGVGRFLGGVLSLAILLAIIMTAGEYHAKERIEAERNSVREVSRYSSGYVPPSGSDGWGEESLDANR